MPRKKKPPLTFVEQMRKLSAAKLKDNVKICQNDSNEEVNELESLDARVRKILGMTERIRKNTDKMLFFVMYDIENNKVRRLVSNYLIRKGCTRVQRSIFLAETAIETYNEIKSDLAEVQDTYENNDSIIVLPISTDYLKMMKIIGQKIEVDVITHSRNTLFF